MDAVSVVEFKGGGVELFWGIIWEMSGISGDLRNKYMYM